MGTEILVDAHNFKTLIFTDGSVEQSTSYVRNTHGRASFAIVTYDNSYNHINTTSMSLPCLPDSYTAEIAAIHPCVNSITEQDGNVVIYTDSLSTLLALSNPPPQTRDIANLMDTLLTHDKSMKGTITLRHVKAHNGVIRNETADIAADWNTVNIRGLSRPPPAPLTNQAFQKQLKDKLITQSIAELRTLPSKHRNEEGLSRSCTWFLRATKGKPLIPTPGLYDSRLEKEVAKLRSNASHLLGTFRLRRNIQSNNHCVFCHQPDGHLGHLLRDCVTFSDHRPEKVPLDILNKPEGYEFAKHIVAAAEKLGLYTPYKPAPPQTTT